MAYDNEFIIKLIGFGLTAKEAQFYFHLLKYGPKSASFLAKSFKTYREAIHRTLAGVIDEDMVNPPLESLTIYSAVDLDMALVATLKMYEGELREMEARKQELKELSKQQNVQ